jgi:ubiquinone/menaquinone biosynthesis C-methylase UbiE
MSLKPITDASKLHDDKAQRYYDRYVLYDDNPYESTFTYGRKKIWEIIDSILSSYPPPQEVLDIGCGTGYNLKILTEKGYHCSGIDASQKMVERAQQDNPGLIITQADARDLPFGNSHFHIVISIEVLRYIPDSEKAISEIYRILKRGGIAVVTVGPRLALHGYAFFNRLVSKFKITGFSPTFQYFETSSSVKRKFMAQGFKHINVKGCFLGPFSLLSRVISKKTMETLLYTYEPLDNYLQKISIFNNFSNHLIVIARK